MIVCLNVNIRGMAVFFANSGDSDGCDWSVTGVISYPSPFFFNLHLTSILYIYYVTGVTGVTGLYLVTKPKSTLHCKKKIEVTWRGDENKPVTRHTCQI